MFVDRVTIDVQAGDGGNGSRSFRRERYVPKGGPDGGDGGNGGSVIFEAKPGVNHLAALAHKKLWKADRGGHGQSSNRHGRNGEDIIIQVPPGTVICDGKEGFVIKDLAEPEDRVVAAHGGKGGKGNTHFKSSINRAPRECTPGGKGEHRRLVLELKTIADAGLLGKPNAGKSTLLARVTQARPEAADYPFTTKHPHLGQVKVDADYGFVLADIPGLIEGAHTGAGLGHEFLRHIERAGVLVHLVEPDPMDGTDPIENYHAIRRELLEYSQPLGDRQEIIAVTKAELPGAEEVREKLAAAAEQEVHLISSVTGAGLRELMGAISLRLAEERGLRERD